MPKINLRQAVHIDVREGERVVAVAYSPGEVEVPQAHHERIIQIYGHSVFTPEVPEAPAPAHQEN